MSKLSDKARMYARSYGQPPYGEKIEGTAELLLQLADRIEEYEEFEEIFRSKMTDAACEILEDKEEFAKWLDRGKWIVKKCDEYARAEEREKDKWIPCCERLPEESLNSVIGWDAYRKRPCFVQRRGGRWILGDDTDFVLITAWRPLPEPYKPESGGRGC